ncbi:MAG: alpha/beta hydrolase-fold protein [Lutibacter sp.]|nr:alpha/beta hydrolase-fold protein [Lutibacter sp.]MDT8418488.1 alpha/beta hydrolase-fold protein [Lutibacter sp.]
MKTLLLKKLELLCVVLLISSVMHSQNTQLKKFNSTELNEERYLKIYVPPGYKSDEAKLYPLTIVLDAEYLFDVYVGNSILFSAKEKAPEQIIVGINQNQYNERIRDCGYSKENSLPTANSEAFYRFIRSELLDYLEENYRLSPFKTIVGNTLTGNFINYFLIEDDPGFNAFVAINPYYATDMPAMIHQKIPSLKNENRYYYLSGGSYLAKNWKTAINGTNELLKTANNPKFRYHYEFFENSNSVASIGQSIPSAFAFIFDLYSAISKEEYEKSIKDLSPADAIAYLENKYVEIDYLFGSNLKIRESDIFTIESIILDKENGDYLKNFGEMINKLYKESPIGDYYIGRYYETGGKFKQALDYYKNGYMKLPEGDPNADGYYENIERVLKKRDGTYKE